MSKNEVDNQFKRIFSGGSTEEHTEEIIVIKAGVRYKFNWLTIKNGDVTTRLEGEERFRGFGLIHDCFFFGMPEVTYHADTKEIHCEKGIFVIESWLYPNKADRMSVYQERS